MPQRALCSLCGLSSIFLSDPLPSPSLFTFWHEPSQGCPLSPPLSSAGPPSLFTSWHESSRGCPAASWKPTSMPFDRRLDKYAKYSFLPQNLEVHWFSVINSCVTVLLLTAFLATILLRVLRKDLAISIVGKDAEDGFDDHDQGWKCLRGDVFRFPRRRPWLCAAVGAGAQLGSMGAVGEHRGGYRWL